MSNELFSHKNTINQSEKINIYLSTLSLDNESLRREFLINLNENDFFNILKNISSLVRFGDTDLQTDFDGENIYSAGQNPFSQDKEQALIDSFKVAKRFLNNTSLDDKEALIYAGIIVYNGITLTHPFVDGNGRLSRVISYAVINGVPDLSYLSKTLLKGAGVGKETWNLDVSKTFRIFDKETFNGNQPDKINIENYHLFNNKIIINEGIIRTLIEITNSEHFNKLLEKHINNNNGNNILNGSSFVEELLKDSSELELDQWSNNLIRIKHFNNVRGFLNAMTTDSSVLQNNKPYIDPFTILSSYSPEEEQQNELVKDVISKRYSVDLLNENELEELINKMPLREQLYLERLKQVSRLPSLKLGNIDKESSYS